jgi:Asparagine synthase
MRLFQNGGIYASYRCRLDELAAKELTFDGRRQKFLQDRFGAIHFLKPVLDSESSAFFTNGDDRILQRRWAQEKGMSRRSSLEEILLAQIEEHRTEVFYNLHPVLYGTSFANRLPTSVKIRLCWLASPAPGIDLSGYHRTDALTDLDQILDDNDDVYIGLPNAVWLIYRELSRQNVPVSLDGHGADELMGAYLQDGQSGAFRMRNALAGISSNSALARRGVDLLRALMIKRQGQYFLRGGLRRVPGQFSLVGDDDVLPRDWGSLNRRLYRMFHGTVLPTILRNFDRLSMAHGIEVRMPFMDWRLVTYTMALPETSKTSDGYTKVIARRAMENQMPESIRMGRRKVGFNSPMPEWLNGPLSSWTANLLDQKVPAFAELVNELDLRTTVSRLTVSKTWDWESVGRTWPYLNMKLMLARL